MDELPANLVQNIIRTEAGPPDDDPARLASLASTNGTHIDGPADSDIAARFRSELLTLDQLRNVPRPDWLVEGLLELDSVAMVYGKRSARKSFLMIDWLCRVSTGARFLGRNVTIGRPLYVVAEGVGGLSRRFDGWRTHWSQHDPRVDVLPLPVNLLAAGTVGQFIALVEEIRPTFIVLDTLSRMLVGGDENSAKDASVAVESLDLIRRATGACVAVVHHAGKTAGQGGRGSSAFEAAFDTVIRLEASDDAVITVTTEKQKNHEEANPIRLSQIVVNDGDSIVLDRWRGDGDEVPKAAIRTLVVLQEIEMPGGISTTVWKESSEIPHSTFMRHRKGLAEAGLVENVGSQRTQLWTLTDEGRAACEAANLTDEDDE